ncbi:hypothetical protein ACJX0J_007304, partial [Zea mays]
APNCIDACDFVLHLSFLLHSKTILYVCLSACDFVLHLSFLLHSKTILYVCLSACDFVFWGLFDHYENISFGTKITEAVSNDLIIHLSFLLHSTILYVCLS